jgi:hypothetical protein
LDQCDRPWKQLLKITDVIDTKLFFCSTTVIVGDGRNTPFWEARWLDGVAPRDLTPGLFKVARFKRRIMHDELKNNSWIRNLQGIDYPALLEKFTLLFMAISLVVLSNQNDQIYWKWTRDECYSVASAYECQSYGTMIQFPAGAIWKTRT